MGIFFSCPEFINVVGVGRLTQISAISPQGNKIMGLTEKKEKPPRSFWALWFNLLKIP
jgi:hypothetical protein